MSRNSVLKSPPRWYTEGNGLPIVELPSIGSSIAGPPQLPTRVLPVRNHYSIPAPVLSEVISYTQRLLYFSAQVAVFGNCPDFSSVAHLDKDIKRAATLHVSPFTDGSFIIPAELAEDEITVEVEDKETKVNPVKFVEKFAELMKRFENDSDELASVVPIGFLQTLEEFEKVLGRHANSVEFSPSTYTMNDDSKPLIVNQLFVDRASRVHKRRRGQSRESFGTVEGQLVELNIVNFTLKVAVQDNSKKWTVLGSFNSSLTEPLMKMIGKNVKLFGPAEFRSNSVNAIKRITAIECSVIDDNDSN